MAERKQVGQEFSYTFWMMNLLRLGLWGLAFVWAFALSAAPLPPIGPLDLEGRIEKAVWVPEKGLQGVPGLSGTLGRDRTLPAHFRITLSDVQGIEPQTARALNRLLAGSEQGEQEFQGKPSFILLNIPHPDRRLLKAGMKIRIKGYTLRGDEGGTWATYRSLEILRP